MEMLNETDDSGAAIICSHVAKEGYPILRAKRDEPEPPDNVDSGWQFLCNSGMDESEEGAQVWSINDVIKHEPTLKDLVNEPFGTILVRKNTNSEWIIYHPKRSNYIK